MREGLMTPVRIAIIGLGNMGRAHVRDCSANERTELVAVCDVDGARARELASGAVAAYSDPLELLDEVKPEAVIIATPHYDHTPLAMAAFERGVHVLCEKPVGVHVNAIRSMISAWEKAREKTPDLIFAAMFQQRTLGHWKKVKAMIDGGELGRLVRATWIITTWFRTQRYYDLGSWRATWKGEGGGVLLNQCPHNLDLYQWFFGMPQRVHAVAAIGKYHTIEVEDEVTAVFEHKSGMTGHFITSTAESPGTNRLEIVGERGRLIVEDDKLTFDRNEDSMLHVSDTTDEVFTTVPYSTERPEFAAGGGAHVEVTERFAGVVRGSGTLVAQGAEGLNSVMLANAALMSHMTGRAVDLPLDGDAYEALLDDLIARSTFVKPEAAREAKVDMDKSF
jgi:predicted dehydrogenase